MTLRFLLAPVAAFAILTFAAPASAQSATDLHAQLLELRREINQNRIAVARIQRVNDACETPDPDEVATLMAAANSLNKTAITFAPFVGGRDHVLALGLRDQAETNYVHLRFLTPPDICYVPPAE